jgi:hypothetical protein
MKQVLEVIMLGLVTYGLLTLCSCSKDETIEPEIEVLEQKIDLIMEVLNIPTPPTSTAGPTTTNEINTSWETDEYYSRLVDLESTPNDYLEVFLDEAEAHGLYFRDKIERVIWAGYGTPGSNGDSTGWTGGACSDDLVFISVPDGEDYNWGMMSLPHRLMFMYHELGHDLLNLKHICEPGHHMTGWTTCMDLYGNTDKLRHNGEEINQNALTYNNPDPVLDWKRATKDMFDGYKQELIVCQN